MGDIRKQLSKFQGLDTAKSLENKETLTCFIQGLQHIVNGGEVKELTEEIDLCLEAEQYEKAQGFTCAYLFIKRYVENTEQGIFLMDTFGVDTGKQFLMTLYSTINERLNYENDN